MCAPPLDNPTMEGRPRRYTLNSAWSHWAADREPRAREWLVVNYSGLVKFVAGRLGAGLPKSVDTADLVSAGVFGLMDAIDKFDPDHGVKFETYAVPRIRGAILDSLRALDWVPRSVRARARSVQDAISDLEHTLGRAPTEDEIATQLGVAVEERATSAPSTTSSPILRRVRTEPTPRSRSARCATTCAPRSRTCPNASARCSFSITRRTSRSPRLARCSASPRVVSRRSTRRRSCSFARDWRPQTSSEPRA